MISITRGDTQKLSFYRKDKEGNVIKTTPEAAYFTVKNNTATKDVILQKKLSDMTLDTETGKYSFYILPEDTNNLNYGSYNYDIEIKDTIDSIPYVKTISIGTLKITKEVTFAINEV